MQRDRQNNSLDATGLSVAAVLEAERAAHSGSVPLWRLGDLTATQGALIVANDTGNSINGGSGSDIVYAGGGDDTIVLTASSSASASSVDFIDGGTGQNTVEFNSGVAGEGVDLTLSTVTGPNGVELQVTGRGFATIDMTNIQTIELDDDNDIVSIGANFQKLAQTVTIEGVLQPEPGGDTLDLSDYTHAPETFQTPDGPQTFSGVDMVNNTLVDANISVSNFEILQGTNNGDYLNDVSGFKNIDLGNGLPHGINLCTFNGLFACVLNSAIRVAKGDGSCSLSVILTGDSFARGLACPHD